ncbi:MAG TPA: aspartyl protease family protein [Acetobacteraceae bacterium]|nr:aspartyl protease family protein [Acetobacteraceae bacterium]
MRQLLIRAVAVAIGFALAACSAAPVPDRAEACELKPAGSAAVTMLRNVPLIVAAVDGHPIRVVLDTGSESTFLTIAAARRLGLHADGQALQRSEGVGGSAMHYRVVADSFRVAGATFPDKSFSVGTMNWQLGGEPPDGFLGSDVLASFDVDLDLPNGRVTFYRARACGRATPPWDWPYMVLPLQPSPSGIGLFGIPMRLDGQLVTATLDTGAEFTTVAMSTARALGITADALGRDRPVSVFGFGPKLQTSRIHVFRDVEVGEDASENVPLIVADLPPRAGDMLLGSDFLSRHRAFLSYATQRIFISRAQFVTAWMAQTDARR